jgi:hypothetical protein
LFQACPNIGIPQILKVYAKAVAIWELRIIFALSRKIRENFDDMADIADEDEGRPAVFFRQGFGVAFRLGLGVLKQPLL